eukprot:1100245-Prymnesium_polylepis.1
MPSPFATATLVTPGMHTQSPPAGGTPGMQTPVAAPSVAVGPSDSAQQATLVELRAQVASLQTQLDAERDFCCKQFERGINFAKDNLGRKRRRGREGSDSN